MGFSYSGVLTSIGLEAASWALLLMGLVGCCTGPGERNLSAAQIHVAAASSLQFVLPEIGSAFEVHTGIKPTFSFSSSGAIASQIRRGAPIDLFCSADGSFVRELEEGGYTIERSSATYAFGRLVLAVRPELEPTSLAELTTAEYLSVGIAHPDLAPYGRAARDAIESVGAWDSVSRKAIYGENVAQVLAHFTRGNVTCAFLPLDLALREGLTFVELDPLSYRPIEHVLVVPSSAQNGAAGKRFAEFMLGKVAGAILKAHGFRTPEGAE